MSHASLGPVDSDLTPTANVLETSHARQHYYADHTSYATGLCPTFTPEAALRLSDNIQQTQLFL